MSAPTPKHGNGNTPGEWTQPTTVQPQWGAVIESPQPPNSGSNGRKILMWAGYPVALIVGVIIGAGVAGADSKEPTGSRTLAAEQQPAEEPAVDVTTAPGITEANYQVKIKTLSKQCFGSAGCNVDIRLTVSGDPVTNGVAAELTTRVTGDESGPLVQTISLDESGSYQAPELSLSTRSSGSKVKVKITGVEIQ